MLSSCQIRAARALLGISAAELASQSKLTWRTIQRFESQEGIPPFRSNSLPRVKAALENAGVEFIGDPIDSPGVRLRKSNSKQT